jgi:hypothetical protein
MKGLKAILFPFKYPENIPYSEQIEYFKIGSSDRKQWELFEREAKYFYFKLLDSTASSTKKTKRKKK